MTFKEFIKKVWEWIKVAAKTFYKFMYREIGEFLSLLKIPDKSKYSAKRVAGVALIANSLWMLRLAKSWLDFTIAGAQIVAAVVLFTIAAITKT